MSYNFKPPFQIYKPIQLAQMASENIWISVIFVMATWLFLKKSLAKFYWAAWVGVYIKRCSKKGSASTKVEQILQNHLETKINFDFVLIKKIWMKNKNLTTCESKPSGFTCTLWNQNKTNMAEWPRANRNWMDLHVLFEHLNLNVNGIWKSIWLKIIGAKNRGVQIVRKYLQKKTSSTLM